MAENSNFEAILQQMKGIIVENENEEIDSKEKRIGEPPAHKIVRESFEDWLHSKVGKEEIKIIIEDIMIRKINEGQILESLITNNENIKNEIMHNIQNSENIIKRLEMQIREFVLSGAMDEKIKEILQNIISKKMFE